MLNSSIGEAATSTGVSDLRLTAFAGGGEMGSRVRAFDWASSPLGPVEDWPQSLRISVRILLGSGYPMLICWGPQYTMIYNDAYRPILGRTKHPEALGRGCRDVFPEAWDFIGPLFNRVMTEGQDASTLTDQLFLLDRNGYLEECYFTFSYSPLPDDLGSVGGVFVTALETTEHVIEDRRRHTLRQLASRMAEVRNQEDIFRIAAATLAENPRTVPFLMLYRYDPRDGVAHLAASSGRPGAALAPERVDCHEAPPWPFPEVLATGDVQVVTNLEDRFEYVPESDWGIPTESAAVVPIGLGNGKDPEGFLIAGLNPRRAFDSQYRQALLGVADQIATGIAGARAYEHERRRAEQLRVVHLASQRLAAIIESSDDAIISKDLKGIVTSWNPCAQRIFGYTAEEMIGRPITTIIPPELQDDEVRILATIARGERIDHFETVRVTKDGERIEVSLTISPVRDEDGLIVGASKIARDITQRKKAERMLHTAEKLATVGRLAATIAHEINNPLEAVMNLVFLAKSGTTEHNVRECLAQAEEELSRVSLLTKQTLGFYRETRGARRLQLALVVTPLIAVFLSRARNKSVVIHPRFRPAPEITGVPGEIRQLIANLLGNSLDAAGPGGQIHVRISSAREWRGAHRHGARITVADTGPGIPPHLREQVFEPFFTTKQDVGTGLGLWVCKNIVDRHGGSIRLKSCVAPGRSWTVFSIFLPAEPESGSDASLPALDAG